VYQERKLTVFLDRVEGATRDDAYEELKMSNKIGNFQLW